MKKLFVSVVFAMMAVCSMGAMAEGHGVYFGGEIGLATLKSATSSDTGFGASLTGGKFFNDYFAVEGNIGGSTPAGSLNILQFGASAVGNLPLGQGLSVYGTYGYDYSMLGSSTAGNGSLSGTHPVYGVGVSISKDGSILRLGYDVMDYNRFAPNEKLGYLKLGMLMSF